MTADGQFKATLKIFNEQENNILQQPTIEDVFHAVQSGSADQGVVPFENSTNGAVIFTLDLLIDEKHQFPDITVCAETYIHVHHQLLGRLTESKNKDRASFPPLDQQTSFEVSSQDQPWSDLASPLGHINKIYSHPQVWGQCKEFLSKHLKGVERFDVSSTSKAAEIAAQDASGRSAAISSSAATRVYDLQFLAKDIEDSRENYTRFLVLKRREPSMPRNTEEELKNTEADDEDGIRSHKSLIALSIGHESPGSLADCLAVFKSHNLNLTSINSRPGRERNWQYVFLVEIKGKRLEDGRGAVNAAFRELDGVALDWRWLGSWNNALE